MLCVQGGKTSFSHTFSDVGVVRNLLNKNLEHLWDYIRELTEKDKPAKTVDRIHHPYVLYRCTRSDFYVGGSNTVLYYPFPSAAELEREHHRWLRWAQLS